MENSETARAIDPSDLAARLADVQRQATEHAALLRVSHAIASGSDRDDVLAEVATAALDVDDAEGCEIELWLPSTDETRLLATASVADWSVPGEVGEQAPLAEWPTTRRVLEQREPIRFTLDDPVIPSHEKQNYAADGTRAVVIVPLLVDDAVIGAVSLSSRRAGPFSTAAVRFTQELAARAVLAIERARLIEAERRGRLHTAALLRVAGALNEIATLDALMPVLAATAADAVGVDRAAVYAYDAAKARTIASGHFHAESGGVSDDSRTLRDAGSATPHEIAVEAEIIRTKSPVARWDHQTFPDPQPAIDWRSDIVVPLLADGEVQGVLYVRETGRHHQFADDEIALLQAIGQQAGQAILRTRNADAARRTTTNLETILATTRSIAAVTDLPSMLRTMADAYARLVPNSSFAIHQRTPDGQGLQPIFIRHEGREVAEPSWSLTPGRGLVGDAFLRNQAELVNDAHRDPRSVYPHEEERYRAEGEHAIQIPLNVEDQTIGVLHLSRIGAPRFTAEEFETCRLLGAQIAVAVRNASILDDAETARAQTERRAQHLALVNDVGRALSETLEVEELCAEIHRAVSRALKVDAFYVALVGSSGDDVWFPYMVDEGERIQGERLSMRQGPTRRVLETRQPYIVTRRDDPMIAKSNHFGNKAKSSESALYVPIIRDEELIGVISVQRYLPDAYDGDDLSALETIARQAAAALRNATLLHEVRDAQARAEHRADHLTLINNVALALTTSLDVTELARAIHAEVEQVVTADAFYISLYEEGDTQYWLPFLVDRGQQVAPRWSPLDAGPTSHVLRTREPHIITPGTPSRVGRGLVFGAAQRSAAALYVPMEREGRLIGVLSVQRYDPVAFDAEELRTVQTIARQAANAFAHARLHAATVANKEMAERNVANLEAVLASARAVASARDLNGMLQVLAAELAAIVPYTTMDLYRPAAGGTTLRAVAVQPAGATAREFRPVRIGEGFVGTVFVSGQAERINDAWNDARFRAAPAGDRADPAAGHMLVAPLIVSGHGVGVLTVNRLDEPPFSRDEFAIFTVLAEHAAVAMRNARLLSGNRELYLGGIAALASAVDAKDPYTSGHSERISHMASRLAHALGCNQEQTEHVELAALLHDVGKIGIPDALLQKPGPLDDAERGVMMGHPTLGAEMIARAGSAALAPLIPFIRHHHEWVNGQGYPDGLKGSAIPRGAAIIAVVDAFDTMVTDRPYRSARPHAAALEELHRGAGTQFQPDIVDAFARLLAADPDAILQPATADP